MTALRRLAIERLAASLPTAIVEILATRGSVPREQGTRMLVWADGAAGTIGGGRLEWEAIATARAALADARWPVDAEVALGASLGQCCGGAVTLRYRPVDAAAIDAWRPPLVPLVQVYGAGHVGRAVVRVLATLDTMRVQWIDERDDAFPAEPSAVTIERVCVEPVEAEVAAAPAGTFYLVITHQHALDLRIVEAILQRGDFGFLGLIGSMTKRRRFEQQLVRRGVPIETVARMTCPIGIDGIVGKEPPVIAIAVAAQLLRAMNTADASIA